MCYIPSMHLLILHTFNQERRERMKTEGVTKAISIVTTRYAQALCKDVRA